MEYMTVRSVASRNREHEPEGAGKGGNSVIAAGQRDRMWICHTSLAFVSHRKRA